MAGKLTCEQVRPLMTEIADGTLAPEKEWQAQGHLARCEECALTLREARAVKNVLKAAPRPEVSANFEARLAARRAAQKKPSRRAAWGESWRSRVAAVMTLPTAALRPALAAGVAATLIGGAILGNQVWHGPAPLNAAPAAANLLVTHCVAQHRSYAAAQPLADPAAQNLLAHLEPSDPGALAADGQNS